MVSMISFIVVLLAAYAYSAPVVTDVQNATLIMEVENATVGFQAVDVTILARRGLSDELKNERGNVTVGLSSSEESESNETTQSNKREFEEASTSETDMKRDAGIETNEPSEGSDHVPAFTEDTKRGIEVESSTGIDETSGHIEHAKRSWNNQPWLAAESDAKVSKRSVESIESSTDIDETSTAEDTSVPSTSEISHTQRGFGEVSPLTTEATEAFNRRAIGSVESVEAGESSTVIVIKVRPESTTEEQSISSTVEPIPTTEFIPAESSSTSDYETTAIPVEKFTTVVPSEEFTTVVPSEEFTTVEPVPSASTSKILAIIPGTISRTQVAVQPVEQEKLDQVQNQTIIKTTKPY